MRIKNAIKLIVSVIIPPLAGGIIGMYTSDGVSGWYDSLTKPAFNPPDWIFGPVWTVLYILLGVSFYLVWKQKPGKTRNLAITVFLIQMLLNYSWSFIFFYFNMIALALAEIILLWVSILFMMIHFYKVKPASAFINIPYLLWVSFAVILNAGFYILN